MVVVAVSVDGGAAAMLVAPAGPRSKILPSASTAVGAIVSAMAASTLLGASPLHGVVVQGPGFRVAATLMRATSVPAEQLLSASPGCVTGSLTAPKLDLSSTWLLLRITALVRSARVHRLPNVPEQQKPALMSVELPPVVPSLMGPTCAR